MSHHLRHAVLVAFWPAVVKVIVGDARTNVSILDHAVVIVVDICRRQASYL